jgi:hypothetical protein
VVVYADVGDVVVVYRIDIDTDIDIDLDIDTTVDTRVGVECCH